MIRALIVIFSVLLSVHAMGVELNWYKRSGSNVAMDTYKQTFIFEHQTGTPNANIYVPGPGWITLVNGKVTKSYTFTASGDNSPRGYSFEGVYSNTTGTQAYATRGGGVQRTWTIINLGPADPVPPTSTKEETFIIKLWPLGTDLDDVDPIDPPANEKANFAANIFNEGSETVEMRLMIDGEPFGSVFEVQPGEWFMVEFEKDGYLPLQGGTYEWQVKDHEGNWRGLGEKDYMVSSPEFPPASPDVLTVNMNPPPAPVAPKPTPPPSPTPSPPVSNPDFGDLSGAPAPEPSATPPDRSGLNIGGGNGPNGELTEHDIYAAVKAAIEDADDGTLPPQSEGEDIETGSEVIDDVRAAAEDIGNKLGNITEAGENAADGVVDALNNALGILNSMPTSFGSRASLDLGSFDLPNGITLGPVVIDFSEWHASLIRSICHWILCIIFFLLCIRAVNYS